MHISRPGPPYPLLLLLVACPGSVEGQASGIAYSVHVNYLDFSEDDLPAEFFLYLELGPGLFKAWPVKFEPVRTRGLERDYAGISELPLDVKWLRFCAVESDILHHNYTIDGVWKPDNTPEPPQFLLDSLQSSLLGLRSATTRGTRQLWNVVDGDYYLDENTVYVSANASEATSIPLREVKGECWREGRREALTAPSSIRYSLLVLPIPDALWRQMHLFSCNDTAAASRLFRTGTKGAKLNHVQESSVEILLPATNTRIDLGRYENILYMWTYEAILAAEQEVNVLVLEKKGNRVIDLSDLRYAMARADSLERDEPSVPRLRIASDSVQGLCGADDIVLRVDLAASQSVELVPNEDGFIQLPTGNLLRDILAPGVAGHSVSIVRHGVPIPGTLHVSRQGGQLELSWAPPEIEFLCGDSDRETPKVEVEIAIDKTRYPATDLRAQKAIVSAAMSGKDIHVYPALQEGGMLRPTIGDRGKITLDLSKLPAQMAEFYLVDEERREKLPAVGWRLDMGKTQPPIELSTAGKIPIEKLTLGHNKLLPPKREYGLSPLEFTWNGQLACFPLKIIPSKALIEFGGSEFRGYCGGLVIHLKSDCMPPDARNICLRPQDDSRSFELGSIQSIEPLGVHSRTTTEVIPENYEALVCATQGGGARPELWQEFFEPAPGIDILLDDERAAVEHRYVLKVDELRLSLQPSQYESRLVGRTFSIKELEKLEASRSEPRILRDGLPTTIRLVDHSPSWWYGGPIQTQAFEQVVLHVALAHELRGQRQLEGIWTELLTVLARALPSLVPESEVRFEVRLYIISRGGPDGDRCEPGPNVTVSRDTSPEALLAQLRSGNLPPYGIGQLLRDPVETVLRQLEGNAASGDDRVIVLLEGGDTGVHCRRLDQARAQEHLLEVVETVTGIDSLAPDSRRWQAELAPILKEVLD